MNAEPNPAEGAAPPPAAQTNHAPAGLTREYEGDGIRVQWFADRCIHAADCIRTLPGVFNPRARPWIRLEGADADRVAEVVLRCPTGALHYVRTDGGPQEPVPEQCAMRAQPGGPYFLRGPIVITREDGTVLREDTRVALCRCGKSASMPFCDNAHRAIREPGWDR